MKIYTGGGDRGKTSLFSGERVPKDHGRIEAYGDVDELNSLIGTLMAALPEPLPDVRNELQCIQYDLFHLSSWLATTPGSPAGEVLEEFNAEKIAFIENAIDRHEKKLPGYMFRACQVQRKKNLHFFKAGSPIIYRINCLSKPTIFISAAAGR